MAALGGCGEAPAMPASVPVVRGSVDSTVSAIGTLQPISEQRLGFPAGGRITALTVTVGQHVVPGQVLARLDGADARADVASAQARLDKATARSDHARSSDGPDAARDDARGADRVLDALRDRSDARSSGDDRAETDARRRLDADRDQARELDQQADGDQQRCNRSLTGGAHRYSGYGDYADTSTRGGKGLLLESPADPNSPSCSRAERGRSALSQDQRRIDDDRRSVDISRGRADRNAARDAVPEANAERDAAGAEDSADTARDEAHGHRQEARADVEQARVSLRRAQRELAETTLTAPSAGVVTSINGRVGEYLDSGSGQTALAPGGSALPDAGSGVSAGKDSQPGKQAAAPPGAGSLITLKNLGGFQIVAPIGETDVAKVAPHQRVRVTFDAVPGLLLDGTVGAVAPTASQVQGVNNYTTTILVPPTDPRARAGMTAQARIVVGEMTDALVVPSAAIERHDGATLVQVAQGDGSSRAVPIRVGAVGDSSTQVLGGLAEGQRVIVH